MMTTENVTESYSASSCVDTAASEVTSLQVELNVTRLLIQRILIPGIISLGLLGNCLTIAVLTRPNMRTSSTNIYLTALAIYDSIYLLLAFTMTLVHYDTVRSTAWFIRYRLPVGRPLVDAASNTTVWIILTFTIERYISLKLPIKAKLWCTPRRAVYIVVGVCLAAFTLTSPEFFEFSIQTQTSPDSNNSLVLTAVSTEFGASAGYLLGYHYLNSTLFAFLPIILLFVFNALLVSIVLSASHRRRRMTSHNSKRAGSSSSSQGRTGRQTNSGSRGYRRSSSSVRQPTEQRITILLVSVVVVFLICQLPQAIHKLYTVYFLTSGCLVESRSLRLMIAANCFNLLVIINSSVNFLLYSALSTKFRRMFLAMFSCCPRPVSRDPSSLLSVSEQQTVTVDLHSTDFS